MPDSHYDDDERAGAASRHGMREESSTWRSGDARTVRPRAGLSFNYTATTLRCPTTSPPSCGDRVSRPVRSKRSSPGLCNRSAFAAPTWPATSITWPPDGWRRSAASSFSANRETSTSSGGTSTRQSGRSSPAYLTTDPRWQLRRGIYPTWLTITLFDSFIALTCWFTARDERSCVLFRIRELRPMPRRFQKSVLSRSISRTRSRSRS